MMRTLKKIDGHYVCLRCLERVSDQRQPHRGACRCVAGNQAAGWRARTLASGRGPGSCLKKLLATIGIQSTPDCSCNKRAKVMDDNGPDWCEANIDTIVGWLREEAGKRGLPFLDAAGRMLIRRAIANARRAAS